MPQKPTPDEVFNLLCLLQTAKTYRKLQEEYFQIKDKSIKISLSRNLQAEARVLDQYIEQLSHLL